MKFSEFKRGIRELGFELYVGDDSYMAVDDEGYVLAEICKNGVFAMEINTDREPFRVFSKDGIGPTLNTMQGGDLQPFIIENEDEIEKWWFDGN